MEHFKQRQPLANDRAYGWSMTDPRKPPSRPRMKTVEPIEEAHDAEEDADATPASRAPARRAPAA